MRTLSPLILASALLFSACGGGGGGGSASEPAPPTPTPPVTTMFSLSGTISASSSQAVDSDTNDSLREAVSNNTTDTAQPIPNPVTLGGYVNQPGTGAADGRSTITGDTDDYFLVDLLAGQRVTMLVGDYLEADADLYLYDTRNKIVAYSLDAGEVESLLIEQDGTYKVNVFARRGATNYNLAIGNPAVSSAAVPGGEIVPWEAIVKYRDAATKDNSQAIETLGRGLGMRQRGGARGRNRLMAMRPELADARQKRRRLGTAFAKSLALADDDLRARWETLHTIKSLRAEPAVELAEPNYILRPQATPNDQAYPLQWHYPLIGLPEAWETTTGDSGVIVAVIDTGILAGHPDLNGQLVAGYDFVRDVGNAGDNDGLDPDPSDPGDALGGGGSFHGTHVSGTIAARGNNLQGVAGVAYGSRVMPLRAIGQDGGTTFDVEQAIRFAAGLDNDSDTVPTRPANIINLSLGGAPFSQTTQNLLQQVRDRGVVVVAAAGNEASMQPSYPAAYDGVISVSAVDTQRRLAPYSNTGPRVDVAAPGGNSVDLTGDGYPDGVLSTGGSVTNGRLTYVYSFLNGTSMAAPHVSGVVALMKSINPDLTPVDIEAMLTSGALTEDLGSPGRDDLFGHGLINANLAVLAALQSIGSSPADNPQLVSSASSLNFGAFNTDLFITLRNGGEGELELLNISTSEDWLDVIAATVDSSDLGEYRISVNRNTLEAGIYAANMTAQSSVNALTVRIFMSVGGEGFSSDVGVLYVLLYDPIADEPAAQDDVVGNDGVYQYQFDGIEPGEYEIIAGSDADNDLFICDPGESCGAYLTVDQPVRIQLEGDLEGLDFPAEFVVSLPSVEANGSSGEPGINQQRNSRPLAKALQRQSTSGP